MRTSKKTAMAVAGALGLAALGVGVAGPALAEATTSVVAADTSDGTDGAATGLADRVARLLEALTGLVDDGTLTQDQADAVANTLAESDALRGPGGRGHGPGAFGHVLDDAASALGVTEEDLRADLAAGSTLAEVAEAHGVTVEDLVADLVAAATASVEDRVAAGDLTQERADEIVAGLEERITEMVSSDRPMGGRGPGGPGLSSPSTT